VLFHRSGTLVGRHGVERGGGDQFGFLSHAVILLAAYDTHPSRGCRTPGYEPNAVGSL
jgi:hypothetical protein